MHSVKLWCNVLTWHHGKHTNALIDISHASMAMSTCEALDEINLAEEPCQDSNEALTPQKKCKKRLVTKRDCVCVCIVRGHLYADITIVVRI